jgi:hypothetical protein
MTTPPTKLPLRYVFLVVSVVLSGLLLNAFVQNAAVERERVAKLKQWHSLPRTQWPKRLLELDALLTQENSAGLAEVLYQQYTLQYYCTFTDDKHGLAKFLNADDFPRVNKYDLVIERTLKNLPPQYTTLIDPRSKHDYVISRSWHTDLMPSRFGWWSIIKNTTNNVVVLKFEDPYQ